MASFNVSSDNQGSHHDNLSVSVQMYALGVCVVLKKYTKRNLFGSYLINSGI